MFVVACLWVDQVKDSYSCSGVVFLSCSCTSSQSGMSPIRQYMQCSFSVPWLTFKSRRIDFCLQIGMLCSEELPRHRCLMNASSTMGTTRCSWSNICAPLASSSLFWLRHSRWIFHTIGMNGQRMGCRSKFRNNYINSLHTDSPMSKVYQVFQKELNANYSSSKRFPVCRWSNFYGYKEVHFSVCWISTFLDFSLFYCSICCLVLFIAPSLRVRVEGKSAI